MLVGPSLIPFSSAATLTPVTQKISADGSYFVLTDGMSSAKTYQFVGNIDNLMAAKAKVTRIGSRDQKAYEYTLSSYKGGNEFRMNL